jgi:cytochrome c553
MLVLVTASAGAAEELKLPAKTAAFVETYCIDCHDAETEKGDRNFEPFLEAPNATEHLQTVEESR